MRISKTQLKRLAALYDVKTSYLDMDKRIKPSSSESLVATLKAMGASLITAKDIPAALREKQLLFWQQTLEPVIVVWQGQHPKLNLRLPATKVNKQVSAVLTLEDGSSRNYVWLMDENLITESVSFDGFKYLAFRIIIPDKLPLGYHKLRLDMPGENNETLIISSPQKAYNFPGGGENIWGCFLPLYALFTRRSWGSGDYSDLTSIVEWTAKLGGRMAATLPLLPSFFDEDIGPGPYMPASRLFWNEFYLSVNQIPELDSCHSARLKLNSSKFQKAISELHSAPYVDYKKELVLKRSILEELSENFIDEKPPRFSDFQRFLRSNPDVDDYAGFRAAGESSGIRWNNWSRRMRQGKLKTGDYPEKVKQYYLYTQWLANEQIQTLSDKATRKNVSLYLDLPVGVHPFSYDVWREPDSFVTGVTAGAPPDPVFTSGQNWNFPPLHPENIRHNGYQYFIKSLRHQLKQARMLRIDHIMNFHRLFWIPEGMQYSDGVYVGYKAEELYAILSLESHRNKSVIIGEDLGIVPPEVRTMMDKHDIYRMYVGQFELIAENRLGKIPHHTVASLNTHDMFPFASFWQGSDIVERQKLKLIKSGEAHLEEVQRQAAKRNLINTLQSCGFKIDFNIGTEVVLKAVLKLLAASPAYALLVNLEDSWLEGQPQNIPGTQIKQNWSRKARFSFENFSRSSSVLYLLREINRLRKGACIPE